MSEVQVKWNYMPDSVCMVLFLEGQQRASLIFYIKSKNTTTKEEVEIVRVRKTTIMKAQHIES